MEWYKEIFDFVLKEVPDIDSHLPPSLSKDPTPLDVDFIIDVLKIKRPARILDLCCGTGRHSVLLAEKGFNVVGLDLSSQAIKKAKLKLITRNVKARFVRKDMRAIPFNKYFDAIINMSDSFGYFNNDEDNYKIIENVSNSLKNGGKFLLEVLNRERLIRKPLTLFIEYKNWYSIISTKVDPVTGIEKGKVIYIKKDGTKKKEWDVSVKRYTVPEYERMFKGVGLKILNVFGDFYKSKFNVDSPAMIILAQKEYNLS